MRRLFLPVTRSAGEPKRAPTIDEVRRRLGGRASGDPDAAGDLVELEGDGARVGVVVFAREDELDVWVGDGLVRRTQRGLARPAKSAPAHLAGVSNDARVFGSLVEGQRVRYEREPERIDEGTLVEKCRWGALVLREDGTVVGAGFRRLWPSAPREHAS